MTENLYVRSWSALKSELYSRKILISSFCVAGFLIGIFYYLASPAYRFAEAYVGVDTKQSANLKNSTDINQQLVVAFSSSTLVNEFTQGFIEKLNDLQNNPESKFAQETAKTKSLLFQAFNISNKELQNDENFSKALNRLILQNVSSDIQRRVIPPRWVQESMIVWISFDSVNRYNIKLTLPTGASAEVVFYAVRAGLKRILDSFNRDAQAHKGLAKGNSMTTVIQEMKDANELFDKEFKSNLDSQNSYFQCVMDTSKKIINSPLLLSLPTELQKDIRSLRGGNPASTHGKYSTIAHQLQRAENMGAQINSLWSAAYFLGSTSPWSDDLNRCEQMRQTFSSVHDSIARTHDAQNRVAADALRTLFVNLDQWQLSVPPISVSETAADLDSLTLSQQPSAFTWIRFALAGLISGFMIALILVSFTIQDRKNS